MPQNFRFRAPARGRPRPGRLGPRGLRPGSNFDLFIACYFLSRKERMRECVTPTLLNILRRGFTAPGHRHSQTAAPSVHSSHTRRSSPDTAAIMPSSARYPAFAPSTSTHCPPPTERESRGDLHRAADPSHSGQSCGALRVPRRAHATEDPRESRGSLSREIRSCA